jgi:hypothetical protein
MPAPRSLGSARFWAVAALCALALGLRLWSIGFGLPGIFNMDEKPILDRALTFAKGDPNPHNFLYPTLYFYAVFIWEGLFFAVGYAVGTFKTLTDFQTAYFVDPSAHFIAARTLTAVFGVLTVAAVYQFGARLYGWPVGLGAALFMAVAPIAVRDAHYVKLDVPVTFFAVMAHAALAAIVADPGVAARRRSWLIAGVFAGLAISTQYYAAFLAIPFGATAVLDVRRSGRWQTSAALLLWAGLGTLIGFVAASPFFALEPAAVMRDFKELREVDIDRAVGVGLFSSFLPYGSILFKGALGPPVFLLAIFGAVVALVQDLRRGLLLASFPIAFLLFVSNTFPASRYLNIVIPCFVTAAAYGAWWISQRAGARAPVAMAAISALAAAPGAIDAIRWDRFFGTDDTRTLARAFIEREVPSGATIAVQPYSAPIRQSREGLIEALRTTLGDESKAPLKFRLQLAAPPAGGPSYRVLFLGESGKTEARPGDVDKLYIAPRIFQRDPSLGPLRASGVQYVVLTRYGPTPVAFRPLQAALDRDARRMATFSPYRDDVDPAVASLPPFRHNGNTWIDPMLERPGPFIEIWRLE